MQIKILFRLIDFLNLPETEKHSEMKFHFLWLPPVIRASKKSVTCQDADLLVEMLNKIFLSIFLSNELNGFFIISIIL